MPVYQMTGKDGKTYQITGPAGLDREAVRTAILARAPQAGQPAEEENMLEKIPVVGGLLAGAADIPLNVVSGLAGTAKTFTDVFGADNVASDKLQEVADYAEGLTSSQAREDEKTAAAIRKAAEGKGIWEEVKAAARSFTVNPLDTLASVAGSAVPFAAAAASGVGVPAVVGLGVASGVGTVKGAVSDAVYERAREAGIPEKQAKLMAEEAQSYGGENLDMQALGGALGGIASATGFDKQLGRMIAKRAFADIAEGEVERQVERGLVRRVATGIGAEAAPEATQAGQERFAQNIAQQRAGYETDLMQGVAGQAAFEALAGGVLGGAAGAAETGAAPTPEAELEVEPPPTIEEPIGPVIKPADIRPQLAEAAGAEPSRSANNAVNALSLTVSQAMSSRRPEDIEAARSYILDREDKIAAGEYTDISLVEALQRPALDESGTPVFDAEQKPVYEGVLTQAKQLLDAIEPVEGTPVEEAAPVEEAEPVIQQETPDAGTGRPTTSIDEGVGTSVPPSGEPTPVGVTVGEAGAIGQEPVGVGGVPPVSPPVSADAEPDTLAPKAIPEPTLEPQKTDLNVIPEKGVSRWWSDMRRKLADSFEGSKALDTWLQGTLGYEALPSELATAPKLEMLQSEQAGKARNLKRDYFDPIIDIAGKLNVDLGDLGMYLWARSAPERNKAVAQTNPEEFPEGGSGLTTAQANEIMANFKAEGKLAKLNQVARRADALVDFILAERVKSGRMSQKQANALRAQQQFYMPLKGFAKDGDMLTSDMGSDKETADRQAEAMRALRAASPGGSVNEIRQAFGRGSMPFHPLFNLFEDAETAVRTNVQNNAMRPIIKAWKKDPSAFEGIFNVYTKSKPKRVLKSKTGVEERWEAIDMEKEYRNSQPGTYMLVKDNGANYYIEFATEGAGADLKRMYANMNPEELQGVLKTMGKFNSFLKGMLTYKNPLYLLFVAPFRDTSAAIATAMYHQNLKGSPAYKKNLAAKTFLYAINPATWTATSRYVFSKKPLNDEAGKRLQQMIEAGGAPLQTRFLDAEEKASTAAQAIRALKGQETLKDTPRRLFDALNDWVDGLADIMDLNARFATYQAANDVGILPPDAARLALDSSLNLTRRGEMARGLDLIFPFFGAGVEAARKTKRLVTHVPTASKVFGSMIALGVVESYINALMSGDDDDDGQEDYLDQDLGAGLRMSRMVVYYGNGPDDYIKVPIDPMLGYFKFVGNKIGDVMTGSVSPAEATTGLIPGFASLMTPTRIPGMDVQSLGVAITPLVGKPFVELGFNRNFFGSPIYKERRFEEAPRSELGRETTGEGWKWLAKTVNSVTGGSEAVSSKLGADFQPEVYRHFIESYFGGPYQLAKQMAGLKEAEGMADVPGIKSFVGTGAEYVPQSKYFENSLVTRQIINRMNKLTPEQQAVQGEKYFRDTDPRIIEAYRLTDKSLEAVSKEQREALSLVKSDADKKAVLDYYRAKKNELYSAFNSVYNDVKKE
jgi:hypothetical protein